MMKSVTSKKYNTTRSLILSGESRDLAELMEMFPKDKNCYLGDGETLRWRALAGALHGELTPVGIPLPERTLNQTPIHGLNGTYDLASFVVNSAGNRRLQGNQAGWKKMPTKMAKG